MELDDLKKTWTAVDNRLKENDFLKESIILEIIQSKANKSVNKLQNWDMFNLAGSIVFIPVVWSFLEYSKDKLVLSTLIYAIALLALCVAWYSYKMCGLMKFDLAKSVGDNIYRMNRYSLQTSREKLIGSIAISVLFILIVLLYAGAKASLFLWIVLSCAIILCVLLEYWFYWRVCDKNIGAALKSLEELKTLKEKEE
jgi:hypothetical protein